MLSKGIVNMRNARNSGLANACFSGHSLSDSGLDTRLRGHDVMPAQAGIQENRALELSADFVNIPVALKIRSLS